VEAGSNTSTVTLRVVGGDKKGSLKFETVKYGHEYQGTRTRERLRRDSSDGIAKGWTAGVRFPAEVRLFSKGSRPGLGPTQTPIQRVPVAIPRGYGGRDVKLTTHFQLVPR
jgi:hypothetical protein